MSLMSAAPLQDETIRWSPFCRFKRFSSFRASESDSLSLCHVNVQAPFARVHFGDTGIVPSDPAVDIVGESNVKLSLAVLDDVNAIRHRG